MKPEDDIGALLKSYFVEPPDGDVKAAQQRVLEKLQTKISEMKADWEIRKALRKVAVEPLQSVDLPVLDALSLPGPEGKADNVANVVNQWFDREFSIETVHAAFDRLEQLGLIAAVEKEARVFVLTPDGQAEIARGRTLAQDLVDSTARD